MNDFSVFPVAAGLHGNQAIADLVDAVHDLTVWHRVRTARIGLLGEPSDWLVASTPDREGVHRRWGSLSSMSICRGHCTATSRWPTHPSPFRYGSGPGAP